MEQRCSATRYFNEEHLNRSEIVWKELFPQFVDENLPFGDRITVAETLLEMPEPGWLEYDREDLIDELFSILESGELSSADAWNIVRALAETQFTLAEIPRALLLAEDPSIPIKKRISVLCSLALRRVEDGAASAMLIQIAQEPDLNLADSIQALSGAIVGNSASIASDLLIAMSRDVAIPPAWRLKAAASGRGFPQSNRATLDVILDAGISIEVRLSALRKQKLSHDAEGDLLRRIADTAELDNWERLSVADIALEVKALDIITRLLGDVLNDRPHSIAELMKAAQILHAIGQDQRAYWLLEEILRLPDVLIDETEDQQSAIEVAQLLAKLGHDQLAIKFLRRIIGLLSPYDLMEAFQAFSEIGGEEEIRQLASELVSRFIDEAHDPSRTYMGYWKNLFAEFFSKGWISDLEPLLYVANDSSKYIVDRAEAAQLIHQHGAQAPSTNLTLIAQNFLLEMLKSCPPPEQRVRLIRIANSCGLQSLAREHVDQLIATRDLEVSDRRALARLLYDLGDRGRAKDVLQTISETEQKKGFLGSWDEEVIEALQGEEYLNRIRELRAIDEAEPIVDRLFEARDLVTEYGDRRALKLIFKTAYDAYADPNDRLQALEMMEEIGYRDIPRQLLPSIVAHAEIDDYWAGEMLLRFGKKAEALKFLEKAIRSCPTSYRDQIAHSLADLRALELLKELSNIRPAS